MIPEPVKEAFKSLSDLYGNHIRKLGTLEGISYYQFPFPEDCDTGFPQIVAYKEEIATPIEGIEAVKILGIFR